MGCGGGVVKEPREMDQLEGSRGGAAVEHSRHRDNEKRRYIKKEGGGQGRW